ncbi:MAG: acyl-CoA dehydrogenase family protein [Candidatus Bathyarchaeota archaeon]|nr:MAG: acyl-CoA dehydrogenase family protein [Candidatus Bathyarchaeota archaeon]
MNFELTQEQKAIKFAAKEFAEGEFQPENAREIDEKQEFPKAIYKKAAKLGFIGCYYDEQYGGQGLDLLENVLIEEEFCRADSTLGSAMFTGLFGSDLILEYGTEEQKRKYLPKTAQGEWLSSGAFTEPAHGSDITTLDTVAVQNGNEYVINGGKTMITNATIADYAVVLCQTDPKARHRGQSLFIVTKEAPGFDSNELHGKMGIRASKLGEYAFSDVRVPKEALVGKENQGFYHFMEFIDVGRINVAAQSIGMAQGAFDRALKYAKERQQFGRPLADFQVIQHKLADMALDIESARLMVYKAAWHIDQGQSVPKWACMAKTIATTKAIEVISEAMQIFGGYGYLADYDIERYYRDVRISTIYEGTTEIQKNVIARSLLKG